MISHSGYLVPDGEPAPYTAPLLVMSAGHYRFVRMARFHTHRPHGREDYQLLYIASGTADFMVNGEKLCLHEGEAVLYRPFEVQEYWYHLEDKPEIYWVHFTGTEADALVDGLALESRQTVGMDARFRELIESIIRELQFKRPLFNELTTALLRELLVRMARRHRESSTDRPRSRLIEQAVSEIEQRFAEPLTVAELAAQLNMEVCWFSRLFRRQMGCSPQQYLIRVRMAKARELLSTTDCPVGEVARLTGYDNPLYFSRLFGKFCGCAPREYRKRGERR